MLIYEAKNLQNVGHNFLLVLCWILILKLFLVQLNQNAKLLVFDLIQNNLLVSKSIFDEFKRVKLLLVFLFTYALDLLSDVCEILIVLVFWTHKRLFKTQAESPNFIILAIDL